MRYPFSPQRAGLTRRSTRCLPTAYRSLSRRPRSLSSHHLHLHFRCSRIMSADRTRPAPKRAAGAADAADVPDEKKRRGEEDSEEADSSSQQSTRPQPFTGLADVEVQMIMHGLDMKERLALARCSRQLRLAASHPFAWQEGVLYTLTFQPPQSCGASTIVQLQSQMAHISSSLLRFAPLHVAWSPALSAADIAAIPNLRAVTVVPGTWVGSSIPAAEWRQLLSHPVAQQLWEISADICHNIAGVPSWIRISVNQWQPTEDDMHLMAQLPLLRKLSIIVGCPQPSQSSVLTPLLQAPALTDLRLDFRDIANELHTPHLHVIAQLPHLRRLTLISVNFQSGDLTTLLSGTGLTRNLESLHLLCVRLPDDLSADANSFAALTQLHTVILDTLRLEPLLPLLAHAPMLRHLHLFRYGKMHLSVSALNSLKAAAPQLHMTVTCMPFTPSVIIVST